LNFGREENVISTCEVYSRGTPCREHFTIYHGSTEQTTAPGLYCSCSFSFYR